MPTAPYGSWRSPITADLIVSSSVGVSQPQLAGDLTYWVESRPTEAGRNVIVRRDPDGRTEDVNPPPFNARTRVHEYGGGDYLVDGDTVYFANFADQHLYLARPNTEPIRLTGHPLSSQARPEPGQRREGAGSEVSSADATSPSPPAGRGPGGGVSPNPNRYADLTLDRARNRLICVREDHTQDEPALGVNTIVATTGPTIPAPLAMPQTRNVPEGFS
jgi:hypothetical protein